MRRVGVLPTETDGLMWLREIVFQGVFGVERPAKIKVERDFCSLSLPPGASAGAFRVIILSLLYPDTVSELALRTLGDSEGDSLRFGAVIEAGGVSYKVLRQVSLDSVTAQKLIDGRAAPLAKGAKAVAHALAEALDLPDLDDFLTLYCWDFGEISEEDPERERLLDLYCRGLRSDALELEADAVRGDLEQAERQLARLRRPLDERANLQRELDELAQVAELSEEDHNRVRSQKDADASFQASLSELEEELVAVRDRRVELGLVPLRRDWIIVGTAAAAVVIFVLSALTGVRVIALANLLILGVTASSVLRRFGQAEDASLLDIQAEQTQRRMAALSEAHQAGDGEVNQILAAAGVSSGIELDRALSRARSLRAELDGDASEHAALSAQVEAAEADLQLLRARADGLRDGLEAIGEVDVPSYEVEHAVVSKGLDLPRFKRQAALTLAVRAPISTGEAALVMRTIAERRGLFVGTLNKRTVEAWNKFNVLLLGRGWDDFDLEPEGTLRLPSRTRVDPNWDASHPTEVALVLRTLAMAILMTTPLAHDAAKHRLACIAEPFSGLSAERAAALSRVLKSMAGRANVLLLLAT